MKILKFGGTSLGSLNSISNVKKIIAENEDNVAIVVSAFGDSTDTLHSIAEKASAGDAYYIESLDQLERKHYQYLEQLCAKSEHEDVAHIFKQLKSICQGVCLLKELTSRSLDYIMSSGELLSGLIISDYLKLSGKEVAFFDSREVIKTDDSFGDAIVDFKLTNSNLKKIKANLRQINVFPGFIASTIDGETTTLGRGGSDYTAAILAAGFGAESLEIWTDVSGIMSANPHLVKHAHPIDNVSYNEALELSHFGAKVLYFQSILPVYKAQIPVRVKNTFKPEDTGTLVSVDNGEDDLIKGISSIDQLSILTISGGHFQGKLELFAGVMKTLSDSQVQCVFVSHSNADHSITLCIKSSDETKAREALVSELANGKQEYNPEMINFEHGYALIALVGSNMRDQVGVSGNMFHVLGRNGVSIKAIAQGSSEMNISAIIPEKDLPKSLNVLHESFFLSRMKRINLFVVGTGNVGKAFLDQLTRQFGFLKEHHQLNLKIIGIANSRKMFFEKDGIPLSRWEGKLAEGEPFSSEDFIRRMEEFNYRNSIFIDITASADIAGLYPSILRNSVSVVTPNKIAATRSLDRYKELKDITRRIGSQFLIETNVCAGLPILSTLSDLIRSGDTVVKLEAVLSGTLNFLFNEYDGTISFSEVIKKAKELGYTEPDPRLDLSGEDVVRKLLILTRESGYDMEMDEIDMVSFLPESCKESDGLEEFYNKVEAEEEYFRTLVEDAKKVNSRLKVVATYENGKGNVRLKQIDPSHPFYNLEGKDNVVLFYTNRYSEQPLVIKGAGAGAEVTASGIFADVLRISQSDF